MTTTLVILLILVPLAMFFHVTGCVSFGCSVKNVDDETKETL